MSKLDYKKVHKEIYKVSSKKPVILDYPQLQYIAIKGKGAPEGDLFNQSLQSLYGVAYTLSMSAKNDALSIPNFVPFVCPPLEGHWTTIDDVPYDGLDKSVFAWELRILMPNFVKTEHVEKAKTIASSKKDNDKINDVNLIVKASKKCCIMMHLGSFDSEGKSFDQMESYTNENGHKRKSKNHNEIYLSDFRKVSSDKLKTVLVFEVE